MDALISSRFRRFHEKANGDALLDIKYVFVFASIRRTLLLFCVTMQIEQVGAGKRDSKAFAHAAKSGIIQIAMIGNETDHADARAFDLPVRKANNFT